MSLKNYHIYHIKLKTHVFRRLGSCEISREKHKSFHEKLLVTKQSRDSNETLCMKLKNFYFPKVGFAGSSKSRASRKIASEPVFEEKHKNSF